RADGQLLELRRADRPGAGLRLRALQYAVVDAGPESDRGDGRAPAAGRRGVADDRPDAAGANEAREGGGRIALRGAARGRRGLPARIDRARRDGAASFFELAQIACADVRR